MASQPSTITLSVDADLDGASPADEVYSSFDTPANRHIYHGENHSPVLRDTMTMYRTLPKRTATFYGVTKSNLKFTMDEVVDTPDGETTTAPGLGGMNFSIPVGFTLAGARHLVARMKACLDKEGFLEELVTQGKV